MFLFLTGFMKHRTLFEFQQGLFGKKKISNYSVTAMPISFIPGCLSA